MAPDTTTSVERGNVERDFQHEIDVIQSRQLTPDNIDTYADDALDDLIAVVEQVVADYEKNPIIMQPSRADQEAAAFRYSGLQAQSIERMLDHIAHKAEEIHALDGIIAKITEHEAKVIVPPDEVEVAPSKGGHYEAKKRIARLKTVLFVLSNQFGLDVEDKNQVNVMKGVLRKDMWRSLSYHMIEIQPLERSMLVCDEEGNATFVFDTKVLDRNGMSNEDLMDLTKTEIGAFLKEDPEMGRRIEYSNKFVADILAALSDDFEDMSDYEQAGQYLAVVENVPEGYKHINQLARDFGTGVSTLRRSMKRIGEEFGEVKKYRFAHNTTYGFSPEQQQLIYQELSERGHFTTEEAPDGIAPSTRIAEEAGVSKQLVDRAIQTLGESLGEVNWYRFGSTKSIGYDEAQQMAIIEELDRTGKLADSLPEGYCTVYDLSERLGVSDRAVKLAESELAQSLGELKTYKIGTHIQRGYSPAQQEILTESLSEKGGIPVAPEDYMTAKGLAKRLNISPKALADAAKDIADSLGEVNVYRVPMTGQAVPHYSPAQQALIFEQLALNNISGIDAPEGVTTVERFAREIHIGARAIRQVMNNMGEQLGDMPIYRFYSRYSKGINNEQREMIKARLYEEGYMSLAPEGYKHAYTLSKEWGISNHAIKKMADSLGSELGEVEVYRSASRVTDHYSPEQQEKIYAALEAKGVFLTEPPEGVISVPELAKKLGKVYNIISNAIKELGYSDEDMPKYRFSGTPGYGLNAEQQQEIEAWLAKNDKLSGTPPEGYLSVTAYAASIGISLRPVQTALEDMSTELGEIKKFQFGSIVAGGLSPDQQHMLTEHLELGGWFTPKAPEGYVAKRTLIHTLHVGESTLMTAAAVLHDQIGDIGRFMFGTNRTLGFSPDQAAAVAAYLENSRRKKN